MQERTDDILIAYLDGELETAERCRVDAWLEADAAARDRLTALAASAALLRGAFDEIINEPLPERLIAAARGETAAPAEPAQLFVLKPRVPTRERATGQGRWRQWRVALPVAASVAGVLLGGGAGYYGVAGLGGRAAETAAAIAAADNNSWLDNAAGYYKLLASAGDTAMIDVPATADAQATVQKISQSLPQQVRPPDLKPWGLTFRGARLVVVEGRPAAQLVYTTDNKAIGPLTLIIGSTKDPDIPPTFDRRQNLNLLYWRHQGRAYTLVGQSDLGYLWGIANDVAWQLDAI